MKYFYPVLIILLASAIRLLPHIPNFSPIGAIALFSSVILPFRFALILPLSVMFISDYFLGFHATLPWVYGSFALITLLGLILRRHFNPLNTLKTSLASSVLFYTITNLGVFISTNLYPHTFSGLIQCYIAAIPFFRNTLNGDLFYNSLLFGSYFLAMHYFSTKAAFVSAFRAKTNK